MFGTVVCPSSGVYSLYTQQWYTSYTFVDSFQAGPGWIPSWSFLKAVYKPVWHIPLLSVQWINSWRWTEELSETCRVSCQNKFVKLVHLVGLITKKFVTMHGHTNVKYLNWTYNTHIYVHTHTHTHTLDNGMIFHSTLLMELRSCDVLLPAFIHGFSTGTNGNLIGKSSQYGCVFRVVLGLNNDVGSIGHTVSLRFLIFNWFSILKKWISITS